MDRRQENLENRNQCKYKHSYNIAIDTRYYLGFIPPHPKRTTRVCVGSVAESVVKGKQRVLSNVIQPVLRRVCDNLFATINIYSLMSSILCEEYAVCLTSIMFSVASFYAKVSSTIHVSNLIGTKSHQQPRTGISVTTHIPTPVYHGFMSKNKTPQRANYII
jgi:hypothetical protein